MTIPTYDKPIEPVLRCIAAHPGGVVATRDAYNVVADALCLSSGGSRGQLLPSGPQPMQRHQLARLTLR